MELHAIEFEQKVVRELDIGLVDLVDEQDRTALGGECLPELAALDVIRNIGDAGIAELAVPQARDRVVLVEPLLGLRSRLDVPGQKRRSDALGNLFGQHRLAGSGLAFHQKRPFEDDRRVDRDFQVLGGDIVLGTGKPHRSVLSGYPAYLASRPGAATRLPWSLRGVRLRWANDDRRHLERPHAGREGTSGEAIRGGIECWV